MKPLVLFDVDGVINVNKPKPKRAANFEFVEVAGFPIYYRPAVVDYINALARHPELDVRWLSTWHDTANVQLGPAIGLSVGMPFLPEESGSEYAWDADWWKAESIFKHLDGDQSRPVVWVDDLVNKTHRRRFAGRENWLFIRTYPDLGLREEEMERIDAFLAKFTSWTR